MYNNEVTYADKWDTPENKAARDKLSKKYFDKSACAPDCPTSWAPEVLEMLDTIDRELGFRYNEGTMRGYYIQGNPLQWFVTNPIEGLIYAFKHNVFGSPETYKPRKKGDKPSGKRRKSFFERLEDIIEGFTQPIGYGLRALKIRHLNPRLNKWFNKRISLGQIKEKYGELKLYYSAPIAFEKFIEGEIRKCEIKLAMKGAYYPLESFWNSGVSYNIENEYEPDSVTLKHGERNGEPYVTLTKTTYRKAMKELGINLEEVKAKAEQQKAAKDEDGKA